MKIKARIFCSLANRRIFDYHNEISSQINSVAIRFSKTAKRFEHEEQKRGKQKLSVCVEFRKEGREGECD